MSLQKIKKIAKKVRLQAEIISDGNSSLEEMCGICSYWIFKLCKQANIKGVRFATNREHAFILWNDYIIDVTATQFGVRNRIVVKNILNSTAEVPSYWEIHHIYDSIRSINREFKKWPDDQRPSSCRFWQND